MMNELIHKRLISDSQLNQTCVRLATYLLTEWKRWGMPAKLHLGVRRIGLQTDTSPSAVVRGLRKLAEGGYLTSSISQQKTRASYTLLPKLTEGIGPASHNHSSGSSYTPPLSAQSGGNVQPVQNRNTDYLANGSIDWQKVLEVLDSPKKCLPPSKTFLPSLRNVITSNLPLTTEDVLEGLERLHQQFKKGKNPHSGPAAYLRGIFTNLIAERKTGRVTSPVSTTPVSPPPSQRTPKRNVNPAIKQAVRNLSNGDGTPIGSIPPPTLQRLISQGFIQIEDQLFFPKLEWEYLISSNGLDIHVEAKKVVFNQRDHAHKKTKPFKTLGDTLENVFPEIARGGNE